MGFIISFILEDILGSNEQRKELNYLLYNASFRASSDKKPHFPQPNASLRHDIFLLAWASHKAISSALIIDYTLRLMPANTTHYIAQNN